MDQALRSELRQDLRDALDRVDTMLEEDEVRELDHVSEQFSCLMGSLVKLRNHLIQANRDGIHVPELPSLEEVNAMISVVASVEYPRVGIHWPRIRRLRDGLDEMIRSREVH